MSKQVRLRRGTTAQHATFTGADGEMTFDTTRKCLVVHDGVTPGGAPVAGFVLLNPGSLGAIQSILSRVVIAGGGDIENPSLQCEGALIVKDEIICHKAITAGQMGRTHLNLAYAANLNVDCMSSPFFYSCFSLTLAGDLALTVSGLYSGYTMVMQIIGDGSLRNLTFPGSWKWVGGAAPATLAAGKRALLELFGFDTGILARWSVQT